MIKSFTLFVSAKAQKIYVNVPARTEVYSTAYGDVRGVVLDGDSNVELFAGIPYAAPPVGELRWKKPQDPEPWADVLECDTFAPMSMQTQNLPIYSSLAQIIGFTARRIRRTVFISTFGSRPETWRRRPWSSIFTAARCKRGSRGTRITAVKAMPGTASSA